MQVKCPTEAEKKYFSECWHLNLWGSVWPNSLNTSKSAPDKNKTKPDNSLQQLVFCFVFIVTPNVSNLTSSSIRRLAIACLQYSPRSRRRTPPPPAAKLQTAVSR